MNDAPGELSAGAAGAVALLRVRDLSIVHQRGGPERPLVTDVSFDVRLGQTVGLVGESGSGKSLTARALVALLDPELTARGSISFDGKELIGASGRVSSSVRGHDIALLMQDPFTMLNPMMTAGAHIAETLRSSAAHQRTRADTSDIEIARRLAEVGIADPGVAKRYPFELSGGMSQRVALAAALAGDPRLLVADEPTTALDATTQREILDLLIRIQRRRGMSMILITHDLHLAFSVCARVLVMYAGSVVEEAPAADLRSSPAHPYSQGLLTAVPSASGYQRTLHGIPGSVPIVSTVQHQCGFASRCSFATDACVAAKPVLRDIGLGRATACVRYEELTAALTAAPASGRRDERHVRSSGTAVLSVTGLSKTYGRGERAHVALSDVAFELEAGESLGIVGESGSGKTTLARSILGLTTPDSGSILLDGLDISDFTRLSRSDSRRARRTVQCVFQDPYSSLNPRHTIGYTLTEALRHRERVPADIDAEVGLLLERVGLPTSMAGRRPVSLSGGQRQRVATARALALEPRVLVCDEPVAALDVSIQAQVLQLLREVNTQTGTSLLFITHDLGVVRQVTERIIVLYKGTIVEQGATDVVLDDPQHEYTRRLVASMPQEDGSWMTES
jgi:peptide/nickel transport system ATP-binding protein